MQAYAQQDSLRTVVLQEVTLTENRNRSALSGSLASGIRIDSRLIKTYPRLFGYTDPMRYLQSMPGVSTNDDQSGGLHVQGGESSHNLITVSDAPVYGTLNFTGMFSLFNQDHLSTVQFSTTTPQPFLGAGLALDHADTIPSRVSGIATIGLISAQGTVSAPVSDHTAITLSVRRSFINAVYGTLMTFDDNPLEYGFTDANLTLLTRLDQRNTIDLNMLVNRDHGNTIFGRSKIIMDCRWGNTLASLRWRHKGRLNSSTSVFVSRYGLMGRMDNGQNRGHMPANITHGGIKTAVTLPYSIDIKADANLYRILPQDPHVETNQEGTASQPTQQALLGNVSLSRPFKMPAAILSLKGPHTAYYPMIWRSFMHSIAYRSRPITAGSATSWNTLVFCMICSPARTVLRTTCSSAPDTTTGSTSCSPSRQVRLPDGSATRTASRCVRVTESCTHASFTRRTSAVMSSTP